MYVCMYVTNSYSFTLYSNVFANISVYMFVVTNAYPSTSVWLYLTPTQTHSQLVDCILD